MTSFSSSRVLVSVIVNSGGSRPGPGPGGPRPLTFCPGPPAYLWENCLTTTNCACRRFVSKDLVQIQSFPVTMTKGGSWALFRKSAVESTTLTQPFCLNEAVGDLPRHFHFMGEYSKIDVVKTKGTRGKINAIWCNIKINILKCGYELPTYCCKISRKKT